MERIVRTVLVLDTRILTLDVQKFRVSHFGRCSVCLITTDFQSVTSVSLDSDRTNGQIVGIFPDHSASETGCSDVHEIVSRLEPQPFAPLQHLDVCHSVRAGRSASATTGSK